MKTAIPLLLGLLAAGAAFAGSDTKPPPQVWQRLAPFRDLKEFNDYRRKAHQIAKARGAWWASMRVKFRGGPLLAQAEPEPCDPAQQECPAAESLEEVVTTGYRASAQSSITNNQEAGVDEGDIVKAFDRFLVVLMHGRLFSVDTGDSSGQLRLVDRVDAYQSKDLDSWIDEMLIYDDTLLVTGYSYETDSSSIALFRIGRDGTFKFLARYFIESQDYYSWENYATRIVDGRLVIYTPFDLTEYGVEHSVALPRIRRWTEESGFTPWQPLFAITDVYRPIQPALAPSMHVVSACSIGTDEPLRCRSRGIVGPGMREMYVSQDHVYLWVTPGDDDIEHLVADELDDCDEAPTRLARQGWPSAVYRMTISNGRFDAVHTEGAPPDQFALSEQHGNLWALVRRPALDCDSSRSTYEMPLALEKIPLDAFSAHPPRVDVSDSVMVPMMEGWDLQTRFSDGHLLYGMAQGGGRALWHGKYNYDPYVPGQLAVVRLVAPRRPSLLELPHSVDRIELFGANAVTFGYQTNDSFAVSTVALTRQPRRSDTEALPGVVESEGRSHAFNALAREDGSGIFGIPTVNVAAYNAIGYREEVPVEVHFLTAGANLELNSVDKLAGHPPENDTDSAYECEVSCIDWYGNARPIFFRNRIFALIGLELVEGELEDRRVAEVARLDLTDSPAKLRTIGD